MAAYANEELGLGASVICSSRRVVPLLQIAGFTMLLSAWVDDDLTRSDQHNTCRTRWSVKRNRSSSNFRNVHHFCREGAWACAVFHVCKTAWMCILCFESEAENCSISSELGDWNCILSSNSEGGKYTLFSDLKTRNCMHANLEA